MIDLAALVYLLCLGTSVGCAALLVRSYAKRATRLLLWTAACFIFLAVNNLIVVVDLLILPEIDLSVIRSVSSLVGVLALLYGFIWEAD